MPPPPTTLVLALSTLAATACVAEARPGDAPAHTARPRAAAPRPLVRPTPAPRPLVRPVSAPGVAVARPLVSASERPVCGNIATKGPPQRQCTDAVGTTRLIEADGGRWAFQSRTCGTTDVTVFIDVDRQVRLITDAASEQPTMTTIAADAPSTEPLVAACRRGLP
ncbi:MAG: hypothetical protein IPL61_12420 [Myxococcales bacterium]|nr:hypothetical protein [Myxococcales bacterium]